MELVLAVAFVLLFAGTAAACVLALPATWQGFRREQARFRPEARRRGLVGGALTAVWIAVGAALGLAAPWGPDTVLYVIGVGGGALMLLTLAGVAVQARRDTRRGRDGRPPRA